MIKCKMCDKKANSEITVTFKDGSKETQPLCNNCIFKILVEAHPEIGD